jgi:hypothetical protein
MAGSLIYRDYTSDSGVIYAVKLDESNSEATIGGTVLVPARAAAGAVQKPAGLKLRYANAYNQDNPSQKRRFYLGTAAVATAAAAAGATISAEDYPGADAAAGVAQTWVITSLRGEKAVKVPAVAAPDTGLDDGDGGPP